MNHAGPMLSVGSIPVRSVAVAMPRLGIRGDDVAAGRRMLAEECPVALVFNGTTYAVMMASPADLEDFAQGFALTEGIVEAGELLRDVEVVAHEGGYEVRAWVSGAAQARLAARRRRLLGPVGCGLCGLESIEEALRPSVRLPEEAHLVPRAQIGLALESLEDRQTLNRLTRSHHAAALWAGNKMAVIREDVGRHNALDKLAGALARRPMPLASAMLLVTSRASVDLVQKATRIGAPILVVISAPSALAVRTALAANLTLICVARRDGFEIYSRPDRIDLA